MRTPLAVEARPAWVLTALLVAVLGGCRLVGTAPASRPTSPPGGASSGVPPAEPSPEPGPRGRRRPPAATEPAGARGETERIISGVVDTALEVLGTPYVWGGSDENGFDCSGLIQYAYAQHGIELPRVSRDQVRSGRDVVPRVEALVPGDILGFTRDLNRTVSHVGLYLGEGRFVHSSSGGVRVSNLNDPYWREHVVVARRVVW